MRVHLLAIFNNKANNLKQGKGGGRSVCWRVCFSAIKLSVFHYKIMYSQSVLFKNSRLNHLQHSQSERLLSGSGVPLVRRQSSKNFRKRSLKARNIAFNEEQHEHSPQPQTNLDNPPHNSSQLHFLTELLKKKQENVSMRQQEQPFSRRPSKDYEYYDMIVRDLIEEIKSRTAKDFSSSPQQRHGKVIEVSKGSPHKRRQIEYGSIKITSNRQAMRFSLSQNGADTVYQKKITSYVEFLYKLNFSNRMYIDLSLSQPKITYKVKVGTGNNGLLVKSLLKRRFWLEITSGSDFAFSWTQQTNSEIHQQQTSIQPSQAKTRLKPPNRTKLLANSAYQLQEKIMYRSQISVVNEWYERSDCGKISCFPLAPITQVTNHIPVNCIIGAKRILFKVISWYYSEILDIDPFSILPRTVSIDNALCVKSFIDQHRASKKVWILKPGENTNRGNGIKIVQTAALMALLNRQRSRGPELRPLIIQEYIKPFLYNSRKFDIRHYLLVTCHNGNLRGYWYREGYIRTSSEKYDLQDMDEMIHLTNDAIQKKGDKYGKYEAANKLSYSQFQRYLDSTFPHKHYQFESILDRMKKITTNMLRAAFQFMDPQRKHHNFELYGLDFYISSKFKPYLIECNANPCLQINCPILQRIIPGAVQHALRIGLDPLFPPPQHYPLATRYHLCDRIMEKLKYELIFDEKTQGNAIREKTARCARKLNLQGVRLRPQQDQFEDQGEQLCEEATLD